MGDLAVTKHDVRPSFIAPPPGLRFATPRSLSTPIQADYSHSKSSSRTMFFKADEMPFSTDYTEWGLRSSERDCEGPLEHRGRERRSPTTTSRRTWTPRSRPSLLPSPTL